MQQPLLQQFKTYLLKGSAQNIPGVKEVLKGSAQNIPGVKEVPTPGMKLQAKGQTLLETNFQTPTLKRATTRVAPTAYHTRCERSSHTGFEIKPNHSTPGVKEVHTPGVELKEVHTPGMKSSISPSTIKNYVSDINHFLNFISDSIQETKVKPEHITSATIKTYTTTVANQLSPSSLNRHLSSLRYFGKFLLVAKLCETNPAQNLTNPTFDPTLAQIITRYQKFLTTESLSKSTIKNYLSDLKKYLLWARRNIKTTDENLNPRSLI